MPYKTLLEIYFRLRERQFVRSQREFSSDYLEKNPTYLSDYANKNRHFADIDPKVVRKLQRRLSAIASYLPRGRRMEFESWIRDVDAAVEVTAQLRRGRSGTSTSYSWG